MVHPLHGLLAPAVLLGTLLPGLAHAQAPSAAPVNTNAQGVWQGHWEGGVWQGQWTPAEPAYGYVPAPPGAYPAQSYPEQSYPAQSYPARSYPTQAYPTQAYPNEAALAERCRTDGRRGNNVGGALIGGVVGGVIGNRVVSGNRALGTVAGAAVGAVAGPAISKAEQRARERAREEECAGYWARSTPSAGYLPPAGPYQPAPGVAYAPAYAPPAPGYAYAPMGYVMVPAGAPQPVVAPTTSPCTETRTVTYEYVDAPVQRYTAPPRRIYHDKRVREKRYQVGS